MKDGIDFRDCNLDILNALSELEATDFFKTTLKPVLKLEGTFITFSDFQDGVSKFESIKDNFKKACGIPKSVRSETLKT